jgi:hypothetical protein
MPLSPFLNNSAIPAVHFPFYTTFSARMAFWDKIMCHNDTTFPLEKDLQESS